MKPLIYFDLKTDDCGYVKIHKDRLKEIFDEVYQAGYNDAVNADHKALQPFRPLKYPSRIDKITCGEGLDPLEVKY